MTSQLPLPKLPSAPELKVSQQHGLAAVGAAEQAPCYHEVTASPISDPVIGTRAILIMQVR